MAFVFFFVCAEILVCVAGVRLFTRGEVANWRKCVAFFAEAFLFFIVMFVSIAKTVLH